MTDPTLLAEPARSPETVALPLGTLDYAVTATGVLVTAPHGTHDANTATLAVAVARRLGSGYVVARGFSPGPRVNVNRPTEGAGLACDREPSTERARQAYAEYRRLVALASGGTVLRLYVEVHGNSRRETSGQVEVATKGLGVTEAEAVRAAYPAILGRVRAAWPSYVALRLLIEPVDRLYWTASGNKRLGTMASAAVPRAIHLEIPRAARDEALLPATALLVAALIEHVPRHRGGP